jgi:deoxycytidine triphosphate deaminase
MSVLSDRDIIRELGRSILFHPLKPGSIKACDLCLTASEYAYAIGKKQRLTIETEPKKDKPGEEQKFFLIPPRDTALVWTDESVWLSNQFRGPLYSVVDRVSNGLGHIGTRVNPCWSGVLCIALHNVSDEAVRINVRDVKQSIVYLAIEKLSSNSSSNSKPDNPARLDVLSEQPNRQEIDIYFNKKENSWMRGDTDRLKKLMLESDEYKKLKRGVHDTLLSLLGSSEDTRWNRVNIIGTILIGGLSALFTGLTYFNSSHQPPVPSPTPTNTTVTPSSTK